MTSEVLNNKQIEVINSTGPVLCIAGAGTGKTKVLTHKISELLNNNVDDDKIYAFTFTNKAAREMKVRVSKLTNRLNKCTISTFHSFFFQELNYMADFLGFYYPINIIDPDDEMKIIREIIKEENLSIRDSDAYKYISNLKNHIENKYESLKDNMMVGIIFKKLQEKLKENNRMDFDDILYYYYRLLKQDKEYLENMQKTFQYVLIDEAQDMNLIQYEIISKLAKKSKLLLLVGDIDQCIYTFRGSNYSLINRFKEEWKAKQIILEENYRCTKSILLSANNLIRNNYDRIKKNLYTNNDISYKNIYRGFRTQKEEANFVSNLIEKLISFGYKYDEIAILYRNNMIVNPFEKEMILKKIPYTVYGSYPFFSHKEIKSLINHYRFLLNQEDSLSFQLLLNYPKKRIGDSLLRELTNESTSTKKSLYKLMKESDKDVCKEVINDYEELLQKFNELSNIDFFEYLIKKINLIEIVSKEKNAKEKLARILEFKTFIEDVPDDDKHTSISEFINNIYLQNTNEKKNETVSMMTIHQSKGLEFKVVIIVCCNQGILPFSKSTDPNNEEERRLFYVALTRARERLFLSSSQRLFINGKFTYLPPSSFLLEMGIH